MSMRSHHITRREAPVVRAALQRAGYTVTLAACYRYVANLAQDLEPMDVAARARIIKVLEGVI